MHRSRLAGIIIDCERADLDASATFWAGALGVGRKEVEPPYASLEDLGELYAAVQVVDHPSRVHLDIETDDIPAEVARLERLGARKVAEIKDWTVMEAPTGQRFCVVPAREGDFAETANRWED